MRRERSCGRSSGNAIAMPSDTTANSAKKNVQSFKVGSTYKKRMAARSSEQETCGLTRKASRKVAVSK